MYIIIHNDTSRNEQSNTRIYSTPLTPSTLDIFRSRNMYDIK